MRKFTVILLALTSVGFLLSCSNGESTISISLAKEFTLTIGQTANISSENLTIKFVDVSSDSRCPSDVECPWAGQVKVILNIKNGSSSQQVELTQLGGGNAEGQKIGNYTYEFTVEPYPVSTHQIEKNEYRLLLTVSKS
jgi:hypothetical protein